MILNLSGIQTASLYGFPTTVIKRLIGSPQKYKKESFMSSGKPHTSRGKCIHTCAGMHTTEAVQTDTCHSARRDRHGCTGRHVQRCTDTYQSSISPSPIIYLLSISIYLSSVIHPSNYPFIYVPVNLFIHHLLIKHLSIDPSIHSQLYGYTHSHIHTGTYPTSSQMSCILKGPSVTRTSYRIMSMCHWHELGRRRHPWPPEL